MPSVFTCCWCVKMNYDPDCVYYTSFIFDAILFICWGGYSLGLLGMYRNYWPQFVFVAFSLLLLAMGIFSIVQIFTKNTSAPNRHARYVKFRMWAIIAYIVCACIMVALWLGWGFSQHYDSGWLISAAISSAVPFLVDAAVLHGYHKNFE